eukprot:jgi/Mesvir1/16389/Mv18130-RA.1
MKELRRPRRSDADFSEVNETFRRASQARSGGMSSMPSTIDLAERLSRNRKAGLPLGKEINEHLKRLAMIQQRIANLNSITERKKNPYDTTVNPPEFLRRSLPVRSSGATAQASPGMSTMRGNLSASTPRVRPQSAPRSRPDPFAHVQSKVQTSRTMTPGRARPSTAPPRHVQKNPDVEVLESSDPFHDFKASMMEQIVVGRLYKAAQLEALFAHYKAINGPAHHPVLDRIIAELKREFYVDD